MEITVDTILLKLEEKVKSGVVISPSEYVDAARDLNILLGSEDEKLVNLEATVADLKLAFLEDDHNVSAAKVKTEASEEYKKMRKQKLKVIRIAEFIRIAKLRSRLASEEFKGY